MSTMMKSLRSATVTGDGDERGLRKWTRVGAGFNRGGASKYLAENIARYTQATAYELATCTCRLQEIWQCFVNDEQMPRLEISARIFGNISAVRCVSAIRPFVTPRESPALPLAQAPVPPHSRAIDYRP